VDAERGDVEQNTKTAIMKLLANIAFHYDAARVDNLIKVVSAIVSYPVAVDIFIDTNDDTAGQVLSYLPATFVVHQNMRHPFELTSMHRDRIAKMHQDYDWVAYFEDDMMLGKDAFINFTKQFDIMFSEGLYPSFVRVERYAGKDGQFTPDITSKVHKDAIKEWNGRKYMSLPYFINYHAFWMFSSKAMGKVLTSNHEALNVVFNSALYRESMASFPIWDLGLTPMVELNEEGRIADLCKVYHLTNNYEFQSVNLNDIFQL
jgi:hypothetical protein